MLAKLPVLCKFVDASEVREMWCIRESGPSSDAPGLSEVHVWNGCKDNRHPSPASRTHIFRRTGTSLPTALLSHAAWDTETVMPLGNAPVFARWGNVRTSRRRLSVPPSLSAAVCSPGSKALATADAAWIRRSRMAAGWLDSKSTPAVHCSFERRSMRRGAVNSARLRVSEEQYVSCTDIPRSFSSDELGQRYGRSKGLPRGRRGGPS